ncbi:hypothetical protein OG320_32605 [Microbispora sp. NBC_01189]|uniref:hypothetical protein n=1 Tax=Microbispora sp. NBC_01189 TaxID=2903583 RepID=UPI002E12E61C|nr:hypothetical protein OG320_32605 [Microbispora sp. NBC_01189]
MASHLVAAARALSAEEPEKAYEHAKVARRFAGRIGIVREATGIAAYHAGQYAEALGDLRAARRMTGSDEYLPIMADCERGLGRPERALDLVRSSEAERLDRAGRIELAIVESGARRDLGQHDAAVITLQRVPELRDPQPKPWSARLAFAYADALAEAGHEQAATDWFARAMGFDEDGETDAAERYAELTGGLIEDLEEDYDESESDESESDDSESGEYGGLAEGEEIQEAVKDEDDEASVPENLADEDVPDDDLAADDSEKDNLAERDRATDDLVGSDLVGDDRHDADLPGDGASSAAAPTAPAAAGTTTEEAATASEASVPAAGQGQGVQGGAAPGEPSAAKDGKGEVSAFGPAFIEPDFGDVLDDPEDSGEHGKR